MTDTNIRGSRDGPTVLVAADFSTASDFAIRSGLLITASPDAELHVVHCVPRRRRVGRTSSWLDRQAREMLDVPSRLRTYIAAQTGKLDLDRDLGTIHVHPKIGDPADAVLELADEIRADMIVVGTHAREGLRRVMVGSVAEQIVRRAHCPVLVARPTRHTATASEIPDPICPDCADARARDEGEWCELHGREHAQSPHYDSRPPTAPHPASFNISV